MYRRLESLSLKIDEVMEDFSSPPVDGKHVRRDGSMLMEYMYYFGTYRRPTKRLLLPLVLFTRHALV
jgi:hypothetical protein